jgi:hypothetical protein
MVPLSKSGLRLYRSVGSNPTLSASGEVLEWPIRHAWRACVAVRLPWVRIPPSPPAYAKATAGEPANTRATDGRLDYDKATVGKLNNHVVRLYFEEHDR